MEGTLKTKVFVSSIGLLNQTSMSSSSRMSAAASEGTVLVRYGGSGFIGSTSDGVAEPRNEIPPRTSARATRRKRGTRRFLTGSTCLRTVLPRTLDALASVRDSAPLPMEPDLTGIFQR